MIPALVVLLYLAIVFYIGIFAFRRADHTHEAEDFFLAGRSLGPAIFLLSLFGTNMTAFAILGSSGHAFSNGIVTYGLMASSSALIIPLSLLFIGTRVWALGKQYGFITPVQMFRDRWECSHIGTVITLLQAALLLPYIIISVMGGGTTLRVVSGGLIPYWAGGALVALVVMSYVFFGGMRGTAWVNTFQTSLFLVFGLITMAVIANGMGGFREAVDRIAAEASTSFLLTRERVSPLYFFSYTFIPLSSIAFPHITIFCLTARRMAQFKKTVIFYPLCMIAIWLPAFSLASSPIRPASSRHRSQIEARQQLATQAEALTPAGKQALRAAAPMKLFMCATNVRTGRVRIFRESELQLEMPLASACLPFVFQAVEIAHEHGTEAYWDGGYLGNPALWPLFYGTTSSDLLLVQINPLARAEVPDTAPEIAERVSEISFNASLLHEMRAIEFVQRLLAEKKLDPGRYRRVFLHRIASETQMAAFGASSKYDTSAPFLRRLFDLGRAAGHDWLERHYHYVGHAGTVRIAEQYL